MRGFSSRKTLSQNFISGLLVVQNPQVTDCYCPTGQLQQATVPRKSFYYQILKDVLICNKKSGILFMTFIWLPADADQVILLILLGHVS